MSDDYIHKDVVDEMRRTFESQLAASEARMSRDVDRAKGAFELQRVKNKKDIDGLKEAVNNLRDSLNRSITLLGVVITSIGLLFAGIQIYIAVYLPAAK